jgi:hypothetical protein
MYGARYLTSVSGTSRRISDSPAMCGDGMSCLSRPLVSDRRAPKVDELTKGISNAQPWPPLDRSPLILSPQMIVIITNWKPISQVLLEGFKWGAAVFTELSLGKACVCCRCGAFLVHSLSA